MLQLHKCGLPGENCVVMHGGEPPEEHLLYFSFALTIAKSIEHQQTSTNRAHVLKMFFSQSIYCSQMKIGTEIQIFSVALFFHNDLK